MRNLRRLGCPWDDLAGQLQRPQRSCIVKLSAVLRGNAAWSRARDDKLRELCTHQKSDFDWKAVSKQVGGMSAKRCMRRWQKISALPPPTCTPRTKYVSWTEEMEAHLLRVGHKQAHQDDPTISHAAYKKKYNRLMGH